MIKTSTNCFSTWMNAARLYAVTQIIRNLTLHHLLCYHHFCKILARLCLNKSSECHTIIPLGHCDKCKWLNEYTKINQNQNFTYCVLIKIICHAKYQLKMLKMVLNFPIESMAIFKLAWIESTRLHSWSRPNYLEKTSEYRSLENSESIFRTPVEIKEHEI